MARNIVVQILGDASKFTKSTKDATTAANRFSNVLTGIGQGAGIAGFMGIQNVAATAASAVVDFGTASVHAASNLNESMTKSRVIFGESADGIESWAKTADKSMGLSTRAALDAASGFAGLFKTVGIGTKAAVEQSKDITQLGSDLASFFNTDMESALQALKSGLSGESEPLRKFNVFLSETAVNSKLAQMGIKRVNGQFTEAQKVTARYALIMEQTSDAQGDFARTSDGLANSSRTLDAKIENLQARIGTGLTPAVEAGTVALIGFMDVLDSDSPLTAADKLGILADGLTHLNPMALADPFSALGDAMEGSADDAEAAASKYAVSWGNSSQSVNRSLAGVRSASGKTADAIEKDTRHNRMNYAELASYLLGKFNDDFDKALGIAEAREALRNTKSDIERAEAYANLAKYGALSEKDYDQWIAALARMARGLKGKSREAINDAIADVRRLRAEAAKQITVRVVYSRSMTGSGPTSKQGFAAGGAAEGVAWVGEQGPELVDLPPGSFVHKNSDARRMGGAGGGSPVVINVSTPLLTPGSAEALVSAIGPYLTRSFQRTGVIAR